MGTVRRPLGTCWSSTNNQLSSLAIDTPLCSSLCSSTSTKSTLSFRSVLTPIKRGDPRLVATISSGKWVDLKTKAKDPSCIFSLESDLKTHELLDDSLDELGKVESLVGLRVPDVFTENGDDLGIGLGVEVVSSLDEDVLELLV